MIIEFETRVGSDWPDLPMGSEVVSCYLSLLRLVKVVLGTYFFEITVEDDDTPNRLHLTLPPAVAEQAKQSGKHVRIGWATYKADDQVRGLCLNFCIILHA